MKTVALVSQKGGSGKTTLAVHLAAAAAERGRVLLMDVDPKDRRWSGRTGAATSPRM
jgi:chromosome partitioning protein